MKVSQITTPVMKAGISLIETFNTLPNQQNCDHLGSIQSGRFLMSQDKYDAYLFDHTLFTLVIISHRLPTFLAQ